MGKIQQSTRRQDLDKTNGKNSTIYKKTRFGQNKWDKFNNLQEDKIWAKHYGINSTIYKKTRFGQSI
jgi:ribosomal protein L32E